MVERGEDKGDEQSGAGNLDGSVEPTPLGAAEPLMVEREPRRPALGGRIPSLPRGQRSRWWWLVLAAVVVSLALVPGFVSGLKKTPRNRVGISYGGGPLESTHFQRIVAPGSGLFFNGLFDSLYLYPADQQNYIISLKQGLGAQKRPDSIVAPTRDRVQATYEVAIYFKLNIDQLRKFHEQLGLQYQAYTPQGWANLIRDTFRQQIESAIQEETRQVDVAELYGNARRLVELQDRVQAKLSQQLQNALGDHFFCSPRFEPGGKCGDPTFIIKAVTIPTPVAQAFEQIVTKQNEIKQREAEAQAIRALGLTGDQYGMLKAIESGKINFWVLPNNGGVTITGPSQSGAPSAPSSPPTTTTPKK